MTIDNVAHKFISEVLKLVKPDDRVLDVGAGLGHQAERFARAGAVVTAIDKRVNSELHDVTWHKISVEDFIADNNNQKYKIIFSQNLLQFLDKEWVFSKLLPWLKDHLEPGGIIAIKTFYQEPEPVFPRPCLSFYSAEELLSGFDDFQIILEGQNEIVDFDINKVIRNFFITSLIIKKLP